jgi:hypothetical protein
MKLVLAIAALVAAFAASGAGASPAATPACKGGALTGSFRAVPGSPGAGGISYTLEVRNVSDATCYLTGLPVVQLLTRDGQLVPTHVSSAYPNERTAAKVLLAPEKLASATARFSPDVPGPGEGHPGACEPQAYKIRVTPSGHGGVVVAISPPTSVCSHGALRFTTFTVAA